MKAQWNHKKIKIGFERFIAEHNRLPRAHEVDAATDLPSSRLIQKRFGGLEQLRASLGYSDVHFGKGEFRSEIASTVGYAGRKLEIDFEVELIKRFGKLCVHTEKVFHGQLRVDFYIYTANQEFGIDIFNASTMRTFQSSVNIKLKKYQHFAPTLYLAVANPDISQAEIDTYITKRKSALSSNISLVTLPSLRKHIKKFIPLHTQSIRRH